MRAREISRRNSASVSLSSWIFILVHRFPRYPCERHLYVSVYVCKVSNSLRLTRNLSLSLSLSLPLVEYTLSQKCAPPSYHPIIPSLSLPSPAALTLMVHRSDGRQVRGGSKNNLAAYLYIQKLRSSARNSF